MYSIDNIVTTSTCDKDGNLKLFSAFQMMQDCSEMWIDSEPMVKEFFEKSGMTQLLASRQGRVQDSCKTRSVACSSDIINCRQNILC